MTTLSREDLSTWLTEDALPLWSQIGWDAASGTVWEALDHQGAPLTTMPKRLRVQARQAYCFAAAAPQAPHLPDLPDKARALFRFAMTRGVDPETGNLGALLAPDGSLMEASHDLYDIAFMLLASAALIEAGEEIEADLAWLEAALARLEAPRGWFETAAPGPRRRQNPHMHMFECSTALYAATSEPRFLAMAETCLDLFRDVFLQPNGDVFEYFDTDWTPVTEGQTVEPGHMAEWIYLLDAYEQASGRSTGVDLELIFGRVWAARDAAGALPDRSDPPAGTRRSWPQTELLKASLVLQRRGHSLPEGARPDEAMGMLWREYLDVPVRGGWYDKRSCDGALLSQNMPASTFYHILVALNMYLEQAAPAPA